MLDITKIKLVIWDLDETFWAGTLTSEVAVTQIEKNISVVRKLTDAGIINSICSKNNFQPVKEKLVEWDIWDCFVFPSIDWTPKGERLKSMIADMGLRAENVLFVDDNPGNLGEAKFYLPEIMTLDAKNLDELYSAVDTLTSSDAEHKRLKQYKVLEKKQAEKKSSASNEEFLRNADIQLAISYDCKSNLDRVAELVARTNQLNYTKRRDSKEELEKLINDNRYNCALIYVRDKFGDYGAVGFYCLDTVENRLQHFLFSCRVLGMGIGQFIYDKLNFPHLVTVDEVTEKVNFSYPPPIWLKEISIDEYFAQNVTAQKSPSSNLPRILLKGTCDMETIVPLLESSGQVDLETNYLNKDGVIMLSQTHSTHILESREFTKNIITSISKDFPFIDEKSFDTKIFSGEYDVIFLSTLIDTRFNIYRNKHTDLRIAFDFWEDLTDENNWDKLISGEIARYNVKYTYEMLRHFRENFEYEGPLKPEQIVENYKKIRELIPEKTLLVILLGGENSYIEGESLSNDDKDSVYRATNRKIINPFLEKEFANYENLKLINYTRYIHSRDDYSNVIDHPQRRIRFEIAADMVKIINEHLKNRGFNTAIAVKPKSGIKTLVWTTNPINFQIYNLCKQAEDKDFINIVGYAVFENNRVVFYEKLGGKIISPPNFQMVIVATGSNFYEHSKILQTFNVPENFIVDGKVFQMPNLNFQRFCVEHVAYGNIGGNEFNDESRMIYPRVCIVGGAVAIVLGKESCVKKISFIRENVLGELRIGNYTSVADNVTVKFYNKHVKDKVNVYEFKNIPVQNKLNKILIGSDVKINSNVTLISNDADNPLVIGNGAIVEDNAVVTKSVPPYAIVAGNPAQIIDYRFSQEIINALQKINWWDWNSDKIRKYFPYFSDIKKFIREYNKEV